MTSHVCLTCEGTGYFFDDALGVSETCPTCFGSGYDCPDDCTADHRGEE